MQEDAIEVKTLKMFDMGGENGGIAGKWTKQILPFKGMNASKLVNNKISLKYKRLHFFFFPRTSILEHYSCSLLNF